jgi:hypothetical protein
MHPNNIEILHKKSIVDPETGCRIWLGPKDKNGYGKTTYYCKHIRVHRLVYELLISDIPKGLLIRHSCHNPSCINIDHLSLGTEQDNRDDCVNADRHAKGVKNGCSKLKDTDIIAIKKLNTEGISYQKLAIKFGVSKSAIWQIITGRSWRHVG